MATMDIMTNDGKYLFTASIILGVIYWLYRLAFVTDIPKLKGIPELPGAIPFYGHLKKLGLDHASVFQEFRETQSADVVQAKLGIRRIIVLNSFEAAQEWIVKDASATIDRPLFYTFHGVVSSTQGGTVGTAPWSESTKRRRTAVGAVMTRPAIQRDAPKLDLETLAFVKDMFLAAKDCDGKASNEIDPRIFFQRLALNETLMMCYGTRIADIEDRLLHDILEVAHSVSSFRSTNNNPQDYVPFLRYLPANDRTKLALEDRDRRDVWLNELLDKVQAKIDNGQPISCLSEGLLRDKSNSKLTHAEIKSINVSLVSGGFETTATTGLAGLGFLSSPEGQKTQENAYKAIMEVYPTVEEAWKRCVIEETVPYMVALVREMLRYYAAIQLLPPRQTMKAFNWRGTMIPKGLSVYMNAQAINHDKVAYGSDADTFRAERWLETDSKFQPPLPHHYSLGAGSRMCPAVALTNRYLYTTFVRLILSFKVTASASMPPVIDYVDYNENRSDATAIPKRYKIHLEERKPREVLLKNLCASGEATKHVVQ